MLLGFRLQYASSVCGFHCLLPLLPYSNNRPPFPSLALPTSVTVTLTLQAHLLLPCCCTAVLACNALCVHHPRPFSNGSLETDRKVQNMVATTDVGFPIRLEGLVASEQASFCNYEPELFPGLIYRLQAPKICVLIFVSGKVRIPTYSIVYTHTASTTKL